MKKIIAVMIVVFVVVFSCLYVMCFLCTKVFWCFFVELRVGFIQNFRKNVLVLGEFQNFRSKY